MRIVIKQAEDKTQESALKVSVIEEPEVIIPPPVEQSRPIIAIKTGAGPQGKKGNPGVSPVVKVEDIDGGHRVTVTDAAGETVFDVMDGEPGDDYVLTEQDKSDIADIAAERVDLTWYAKTEDLPTRVSELQNDSGYLNAETDPTVSQWAKQPTKPAYTAAEVGAPTVQEMQDALAEIDVPVQDVQVNGISVLNDGVANVPVAGSDYGVVKENMAYGIDITGSGQLMLIAPSDNDIKNGYAGTRRAIMTLNQHNAVFYGLAKAAGDTTQSKSSNVVGTYTDEAKAAIRAMLGLDDQSIVDIVEAGLPAAEGVAW